MGNILLAVLSGGIGAAVVAGLFRLAEWSLKRKAEKEDKAEDAQLLACQQRGEEISTMQTQVGALYAANRLILYDRIKHLGKTYIARKSITAEELEDLIAMHDCYHSDLGGNGFLDNLMAQVRCLPIK